MNPSDSNAAREARRRGREAAYTPPADPSDSKKQTVERFIKTVYPDMTELAMAANTEDSCLRDATVLIEGLQAKVKEQDQEIERLGEDRDLWKLNESECNKSNKELWEKVKAVASRAEKAEARVRAQDIVIAEYKADDYELIQKLKARIKELEQSLHDQILEDAGRIEKRNDRLKELEQELLWAADACEKAEAELQSLQRLNYLNVKAADSETARADKADAYFDHIEAEREKLIGALEQLVVWSEAFEALPPDDMKDVFPFSQYTTAGDCRQLKVALGQARAVLAEAKEEK